MIRLQKFLADSGVASRRKAELLIAQGRVSVNGAVVTELGVKVDSENDEILFDGKPVDKIDRLVYIMMHKPVGYVTTSKDQFGRPAVLDLLRDVKARVFPVGRLDYDTSGLLLLTNDGELTFKLTHPKHKVEKTYIARVKGTPTRGEIARFCNGLMIDGYKTSPANIQILETLDNGDAVVSVKITEGRNRQVRKMLEKIGHNTVTLKRSATGKLSVEGLKPGEYRHLTDEEIKYLKEL